MTLSSAREGLFVLVLLVVGGAGSHAQPVGGQDPFCQEKERRTQTLDTRGLGVFYCTTAPGLSVPLRGAHASARPVFYGAVPLAWGVAYLQGGDDFSDAYRLGLAQGATFVFVLGLKHAVGRPRPYVRRALTSRSDHYGERQGEKYLSFPSGHAAVSAALVTSWSLSHPEWYVVAPGATWAVGVALSRIHLGVHYPSDVLAGSVIGVGTAVLVHQLRDTLTPGRLQEGGSSPSISMAAPIGIRVRF